MFGKSRRVENNQIILVSHRIQILESVFGIRLVAGIARKVQFHVGAGQVYRLGRTVHGMHQRGSATHGVHAESSGITEHIQHGTPVGIMLQQRTIVTLVYEESCLLAFQPIYMKLQAVLYRHVFRASAHDKTVFLPQFRLERQSGFALIVHVFHCSARHGHKCPCYFVTRHVHAHAMSLHDGCLSIHIHHQPRQTVSFAMHQTIGIISLFMSGHSDGASQVVSHSQAVFPIGSVHRFVLEIQHPDGNGTDLPMPHGYKIALGRQHTYHLPFFRLSLYMMDGSGKNPGMETLQTFFFSFF